MATTKLYRQDVYLKECPAVIEAVSGDLVVLNQTIFFPGGGGQSCDLGHIGQAEVTAVYEEGHRIYHQLAQTGGLRPGMQVTCRIDWDRRFDNMQRHCGEHILSGIFYREFGGVNRGFHMGRDYMTIDIRLEANPAFQEITPGMANQAELCANEVIWSDAPVTTLQFEERREAEKLPLRKALAVDEEITVVCVGGTDHACDCVACCGTHPGTAGQVGLLKIFKTESYKGMFRIYFEAGKRALADYGLKHDMVRQLGDQYSAGAKDLPDKIHAQEEKHRAVKEELYRLKHSVTAQRTDALKPQVATDGAIVTAEYRDMKAEDLVLIGRPLIPQIKKLLFLIGAEDQTLLLFSSGSIDCGKLVKENASIYRGKGGGNAQSARAIFPDRDCLDTFMDLIEKHLR